jgi:hypothetical protein
MESNTQAHSKCLGFPVFLLRIHTLRSDVGSAPQPAPPSAFSIAPTTWNLAFDVSRFTFHVSAFPLAPAPVTSTHLSRKAGFVSIRAIRVYLSRTAGSAIKILELLKWGLTNGRRDTNVSP